MKMNQFLLYDELPLWSAPFGLSLLEKVRFRKNINILDIGSGSGFPMLELAERSGRGCHVTGIDPSLDSFEMISEKIMVKGITNAEIITGFAEEMPFPDEHFALITANNGLNNVSDEDQVLRECFRVAQKGAQFILTMNLPHTMHEFYEIFKEVLTEISQEDKIKKVESHRFKKRKTVEWWSEKLLKAGFGIRSVDIDGFRLRYTDGTSFLNHYFIKTAFRDSWENISGKDSDFIFGRIEEKLNKIAEAEGEFSTGIPFVCFDCFR